MCKQWYGIWPYAGVDSAPIKANASMESVVLKTPATSIDNHLKKVEEENQEVKKRMIRHLQLHITAPEHQLKRIEKHHQNLRDRPGGSLGASHEKAQLLSNKTHYKPS